MSTIQIIKCPVCQANHRATRCYKCEGRGEVRQWLVTTATCPTCEGSGQLYLCPTVSPLLPKSVRALYAEVTFRHEMARLARNYTALMEESHRTGCRLCSGRGTIDRPGYPAPLARHVQVRCPACSGH